MAPRTPSTAAGTDDDEPQTRSGRPQRATRMSQRSHTSSVAVDGSDEDSSSEEDRSSDEDRRTPRSARSSRGGRGGRGSRGRGGKGRGGRGRGRGRRSRDDDDVDVDGSDSDVVDAGLEEAMEVEMAEAEAPQTGVDDEEEEEGSDVKADDDDGYGTAEDDDEEEGTWRMETNVGVPTPPTTAVEEEEESDSMDEEIVLVHSEPEWYTRMFADEPEPAMHAEDHEEEDVPLSDAHLANFPSTFDVAMADGEILHMPTHALGWVASAYCITRALSWQLKVSPFSFPDLVAALSLQQPGPIVDDLHVAVLRLLAVDESSAMRQQRILDLSVLDHVSWPEYMWEWLRLKGDTLAEKQWVFPEEAQGSPEASKAIERFSKPVGTPLLELLHSAARPTPRRVLPLEYYSLPPETKAELLATLCDDLLDSPTVQAEFERRELRGEFVTGEGGGGGAFAIRTSPKPQEGEEAAAVADDNTDICLVCGVGGSLLCCDGCPAAFHFRCVAETNKTVAAKEEYLCPECEFGGRGEFAGLRVPPVGATPDGGLAYVVQHGLFTSTTCGLYGRGRQALEYGPVATTLAIGDEAVRDGVKALRSVKDADEDVAPSVRAFLKAPPPEPSADTPKQVLLARDPKAMHLPAEPHAYLNRYRHGWVNFVNGQRHRLDETKRKKKPLGDLPPPLPLSRFEWPPSRGKGRFKGAARCGKCQHCLRPQLKKPCQFPINTMKGDEADVLSDTSSKLSVLVLYALKVERDLWGLLGGPWVGDTLERSYTYAPPPTSLSPSVMGTPDAQRRITDGMAFRREWAARLRAATTVPQVAELLLLLERCLHRRLLTPDWLSSEPTAARTATAADQLAAVTSRHELIMQLGDAYAPEGAAGPFVDPVYGPVTVALQGWRPLPTVGHAPLPAFLQHGAAVRPGILPEGRGDQRPSVTVVPPGSVAAAASAGGRAAVEAAAGLDGNQVVEGGDAMNVDAVKTEAPAQHESAAATENMSNNPEPMAAVKPEPVVPEAPVLTATQPTDTAPPAGAASNSSRRPPQLTNCSAGPAPLALQGASPGPAGYYTGYEPSVRLVSVDGVLSTVPGAVVAPPPPPLHQLAPSGEATPTASHGGGSDAGDGYATGLRSRPRRGASRAAVNDAAELAADIKRIEETQEEEVSEFYDITKLRVDKKDMSRSGWTVYNRIHWRKSCAFNVLPKQLLRKAARRGSTAIVPWLKYRNKAPGALPPRLYWIASVESARTAGQLATCARILDSVIRWEASKRPAADAETPFASAVVRGKRLQPDGMTWEFLVEYSPEDGAEEESGLQTFVEWLPEQALPLWLIKAYEEKYRRDGVVPVRGRGAAAAAAVADACGLCAAVYADDKDSLWVACDTCNKWFHCACVGIEQEVLEAMGDEPYDCPECSELKQARRRHVLDRASRWRGRPRREAAKSVALAVHSMQSPLGMFSPAPQEKRKASKRKAPAIPLTPEEAEAARLAAEQRTQERREAQRRRAEELERDLAMMEAEEEEEERAQRRGKRQRRASSDEEYVDDEEEEEQVYCVCRRQHRAGMAYIACDSCNEWYHPECMNTTLEEVEGTEWVCPKCARSRRARPSSRGDDAFAKRARETLPAWAQAALRVLTKVLRAKVSSWFREPVDPRDVPDYYTVIAHPMDLGTVKDRLLQGAYATPLDVLADVQLVWSNCRLYNPPGDMVYEDGQACASMFEAAWQAENLPQGITAPPPLGALGSTSMPAAPTLPSLASLGMPTAPLPALPAHSSVAPGAMPALPTATLPGMSASLAQLMQGATWPPPGQGPVQGWLQPPPPPPAE